MPGPPPPLTIWPQPGPAPAPAVPVPSGPGELCGCQGQGGASSPAPPPALWLPQGHLAQARVNGSSASTVNSLTYHKAALDRTPRTAPGKGWLREGPGGWGPRLPAHPPKTRGLQPLFRSPSSSLLLTSDCRGVVTELGPTSGPLPLQVPLPGWLTDGSCSCGTLLKRHPRGAS